MPECTCRGGNPNCRKCGGWGWIGDKIWERRAPDHSGALSPRHAPISGRKKGKKAPRNHACPFCARKFASINHHVNAAHPDRWEEYIALEGVKEKLAKANLYSCEICGKLVGRLKRHMKKEHGVNDEQLVLQAKSVSADKRIMSLPFGQLGRLTDAR